MAGEIVQSIGCTFKIMELMATRGKMGVREIAAETKLHFYGISISEPLTRLEGEDLKAAKEKIFLAKQKVCTVMVR